MTHDQSEGPARTTDQPIATGECEMLHICRPNEDTFREMGQAAENVLLSELGWGDVGRAVWSVLSEDAEVADWSNAERGKFASPLPNAAAAIRASKSNG